MPNPQRLLFLTDLRKQAGLSASEAARYLGLQGTQSRKTVGAWERGEMTPEATRRIRFLGYLWDVLRLRNQPEYFRAIWVVLADEWDWEPVQESEWRQLLPGDYGTDVERSSFAVVTVPIEEDADARRAGTGTSAAPLAPNLPAWLPHSLPTPLLPLLGREEDIAILSRLLADPNVRLLTVLGPGGIGKTRLTLEVGQRILDSRLWKEQTMQPDTSSVPEPTIVVHQPTFSDGVYFVALAGLTSAEGILAAVGSAFDLSFHQGSELARQLCDHLRPKQLLLLLDNLEHLLDSTEFDCVEFLLTLLQAAPGLKIIATSRARLGVQGEQLYIMNGLACPGSGVEEPADVLRFSAAQLFVQHAQRVQPNYTLQGKDVRSVVRICQMVQGMPLAIELAVTWISVLAPLEIATAIGQSLDFLTSEARDLPLRQQSMRAVFDASWRLLTPQEQSVFPRLALFRGGFSLAAAQSISGTISGATPKLLLSLISKSLVQRIAPNRFEIHELLRQYALEQLTLSGELAEVQSCHAHFFLAFAERGMIELDGSDQQSWIEQLECEHDNLRAALAWGLENEATELVLRFVPPLRSFWDWRGYYTEMTQWFDQVFILADQTWQTLATSERSELSEPQRQQLEIYANALLARAETVPFADAEELYRRCLTLDDCLGPTARSIIIYHGLAAVARHYGNYVVADQWHQRASEGVPKLLLNERDLQIQNAFVCYQWSVNALAQGEFEKCATMAKQAVVLFDQLENQHFATYSRGILGLSALYTNDLEQARSILENCYDRFHAFGDPDGTSWVQGELGRLRLCCADITGAQNAFVESLRLMHHSGDIAAIYPLRGLAEVCNYQGDSLRAACLLAAVENACLAVAFVIPLYLKSGFDATVARTRANLDEAAFAAAWDAGSGMTLDEAIAWALAGEGANT